MNIKRATLAGGCFWGVEELIRELAGIKDTQVGYTGGTFQSPTYRDICTGLTGHAEAIDITFDADQLSFKELLHFFFRIHDPTTLNRQGNDKGTQYRSAVFFHDESQEKEAREVIAEVDVLKRYPAPVVTEVVAFEKFWSAEEEHQDYLQKYPAGYNCHYVRD